MNQADDRSTVVDALNKLRSIAPETAEAALEALNRLSPGASQKAPRITWEQFGGLWESHRSICMPMLGRMTAKRGEALKRLGVVLQKQKRPQEGVLSALNRYLASACSDPWNQGNNPSGWVMDSNAALGVNRSAAWIEERVARALERDEAQVPPKVLPLHAYRPFEG